MPVIETRPTVSLNKIMFATDFSATAEEAGKYAKALALRFGSTVEIAHALYSSEDETALPPEEMRRKYEKLLILKQSEFRAAGIKTYFAESSEAPLSQALLMMERQFEPDLIVAGTTSKSALDRFLVGSTAEHLIRESSCPVLTVGPNAKPPKKGPLAFQKIVFATDLSEASDKAAELALAFAQDAGAHLWITHVAPDQPDEVVLPDGLGERNFRRRLEQLIPSEAYEWCTLKYTVEHGEPADGILDLANRVNADLIVMGARERSFWLMHLRRGVTQDVLAEAPCPVLTAH
jgi:nucleotide-binding universal stress UspA family protein